MKTISKKEFFQALGNFQGIKTFNENFGVAYFENGNALYSYNTLVAGEILGALYYVKVYHEYSKTTCNQITWYYGYNTHERRRQLKAELATLII